MRLKLFLNNNYDSFWSMLSRSKYSRWDLANPAITLPFHAFRLVRCLKLVTSAPRRTERNHKTLIQDNQPANRDLNLEPPEYMPEPLPGWVMKWQNFELKYVGVCSYVETWPTPRGIVLEQMVKKLCYSFYEIRRLFVVMTGTWVWLRAVLESRFRRRNILHGKDHCVY